MEIKFREYNQQMSSFYVNFKEDIKNVIEKKKNSSRDSQRKNGWFAVSRHIHAQVPQA